jgi:hypothetical protein
MKAREYTTTGTITNDGKLKMFMGELNQFLAQFPGEKIIATFSVLPGEQSEALKAYYWKCVVPTMQKALWDAGERKDYIDTDVWIREQSPIMAKQDYKNGRIETEIKTIDELSNSELIEHIETIKQLAAEEFSVFIEDPK